MNKNDIVCGRKYVNTRHSETIYLGAENKETGDKCLVIIESNVSNCIGDIVIDGGAFWHRLKEYIPHNKTLSEDIQEMLKLNVKKKDITYYYFLQFKKIVDRNKRRAKIVEVIKILREV